MEGEDWWDVIHGLLGKMGALVRARDFALLHSR